MPDLNPSLRDRPLNVMLRIGELVHGQSHIIHLEFGEPSFPTPDHIVSAAERSIRDERQGYGPSAGMPWLREAIVARAEHITGLAAGPERAVVTMGGTGGLQAALLALCAPGDEVLTPDPAWPGYDAMIAAASARQVRYPLVAAHGWEPDLDALRALCGPRTRVLVLNTPSNPTGAVFSRATIEALVTLADERDLWILSDECYDDILFEGQHVSPASLAPERTIVAGTCSKSYAMTGWRVGWVIAPGVVAPSIGVVTAAQVNNLPLLTQRAAHAALTGPQDCVREMVAGYRERRDLALGLLDAANAREYTPMGAFYLLINLALLAGRPVASLPFAERLIAERAIAAGPGSAFGERTPEHLRVSLASSPDDLRAGIAGILAAAREVS